MAVIKPFSALRYDPISAGPLSEVVAPPYDVIDEDQKQQFLDRHPANIIRLILGKCDPTDDAKYDRAARTFADWRARGILRRDDAPALYLYDQYFELDGRAHCRRGFIARVLIEPLGEGRIMPHEQTMSGPKEDRLKLMRACRANLSQVFAVHGDADRHIAGLLARACERCQPVADFVDHTEGVRQVLRLVTDPELLAGITAAMAPLPLYIADGHHRYETALRLRDEIRRGGPIGEDPADYVAIDCVAIEQPGMVILPTHRLVRVDGLDAADFLRRLGEDFDVTAPAAQEPAAFRAELAVLKGQGALGCYLDGRFHLLRVKSYEDVDRRHPQHCESWRRLDVVVLHALVIEKLLGITFQAGKATGALDFIQGGERARARVDTGDASVAFLLNPTGVDEVMAVAQAGDRMPPKSTYFYPKLISGLVINPIE